MTIDLQAILVRKCQASIPWVSKVHIETFHRIMERRSTHFTSNKQRCWYTVQTISNTNLWPNTHSSFYLHVFRIVLVVQASVKYKVTNYQSRYVDTSKRGFLTHFNVTDVKLLHSRSYRQIQFYQPRVKVLIICIQYVMYRFAALGPL